jgi:hypothetical protein
MSLSIPFVVSPYSFAFVFIGITAAFLCFIHRLRWRYNSIPYPPGPPGDPIIGNIRQMSAKNQEQEFEKWGKQYGLFSSLSRSYRLHCFVLQGDVNFVKIFHRPLVVLNSFNAARDLLEKRGAIYSSRPRMVLIAEM